MEVFRALLREVLLEKGWIVNEDGLMERVALEGWFERVFKILYTPGAVAGIPVPKAVAIWLVPAARSAPDQHGKVKPYKHLSELWPARTSNLLTVGIGGGFGCGSLLALIFSRLTLTPTPEPQTPSRWYPNLNPKSEPWTEEHRTPEAWNPETLNHWWTMNYMNPN